MDYILVALRVCLVYALLCLGVEVYSDLFQFGPAHAIIRNEFAKDYTKYDHNLVDRCLAVEDDVVKINPFNLPAAIRSASTDYMTKEGCK